MKGRPLSPDARARGRAAHAVGALERFCCLLDPTSPRARSERAFAYWRRRGLSIRATNVLAGWQWVSTGDMRYLPIETIEELARTPESALSIRRNCGAATMQELRRLGGPAPRKNDRLAVRLELVTCGALKCQHEDFALVTSDGRRFHPAPWRVTDGHPFCSSACELRRPLRVAH
ncbi:MAG TPA: hypothetical protein VJ011_03690 [Steroidobacteraceae bacterium]|nr:hypothetical protein [Steroidobacteraceae bacterium]